MARSAEDDHLARIGNVWLDLIVGGDEPRDIDQDRGTGRLAGGRIDFHRLTSTKAKFLKNGSTGESEFTTILLCSFGRKDWARSVSDEYKMRELGGVMQTIWLVEENGGSSLWDGRT